MLNLPGIPGVTLSQTLRIETVLGVEVEGRCRNVRLRVVRPEGGVPLLTAIGGGIDFADRSNADSIAHGTWFRGTTFGTKLSSDVIDLWGRGIERNAKFGRAKIRPKGLV